MKKLLIIIILLAGLFFFFRNDEGDTGPLPAQSDTTAIDASNTTFSFDDGPVTLSNGNGVKTADEDAGFSETVELLDERATGDLNADGKNDAVVLLARSGGGSGVFIYAAAYVSGPVNYKGTNAIFLGDRISPESVSIDNGIATVRYLDRSPDEAFAAEPTIETSEQFEYKDGAFRKR